MTKKYSIVFMLFMGVAFFGNLVIAGDDQCARQLYRIENSDSTRFGYIDERGTVVIPPIYEKAGGFVEGMAAVAVNGRYGFLGPAGAVAITFQYDDVHQFSEGSAAVKENGKWGFIDKQGGWIVKPFAQEACPSQGGMAPVRVRDGWTFFLASTGKILPGRYESVAGPSDGLAMVSR